MTVVAPIGAKDYQHVFVGLGGLGDRNADFLARFDGRRIQLRIQRHRLFQLKRISALNRDELPPANLLLPQLRFNYIQRAARRRGSNCGLKGDLLNSRLGRGRICHLQ